MGTASEKVLEGIFGEGLRESGERREGGDLEWCFWRCLGLFGWGGFGQSEGQTMENQLEMRLGRVKNKCSGNCIEIYIAKMFKIETCNFVLPLFGLWRSCRR